MRVELGPFSSRFKFGEGQPAGGVWGAQPPSWGCPHPACHSRWPWSGEQGCPLPRPPSLLGCLCFMGAHGTSHEGNINIALDSHLERGMKLPINPQIIRGRYFMSCFLYSHHEGDHKSCWKAPVPATSRPHFRLSPWPIGWQRPRPGRCRRMSWDCLRVLSPGSAAVSPHPEVWPLGERPHEGPEAWRASEGGA